MKEIIQEKKCTVIELTKDDVESAVRQFVCTCLPKYAEGHVVEVAGHLGCIAVAIKSEDR